MFHFYIVLRSNISVVLLLYCSTIIFSEILDIFDFCFMPSLAFLSILPCDISDEST